MTSAARARLWTAAAVAAGVSAAPVSAEPSVGTGHVPLLVALAATLAAALGVSPFVLRRVLKLELSNRATWILAIVAAIVSFVFLLPLIVALGSIVITGRTM